jgi:CMP-N,N'-diacetyllegionaminic acid synthase
MNKFLAIIPARKGSKRIKNKNLKNFCGKPLICWTIEAALKTKNIDEIYVSTDSVAIKKMVEKKYNLFIKNLRPKKISLDDSKMILAIKDAINNANKKTENIVLLQPTSPLRSTKDINNAINIYLKNKSSSLVSVTKLVSPYYLTKIVKLQKNLDVIFQKNNFKNEDVFVRNGPAILITKVTNILQNNLYSKKILAYEMPFERSIDINTLEDFNLAKKLFKSKL